MPSKNSPRSRLFTSTSAASSSERRSTWRSTEHRISAAASSGAPSAGQLWAAEHVPLFPRRLLFGLVLFAVLIAVGTAGFITFEGLSLLDAFFTAVSTIATVGLAPPRPLTQPAKLLAVALIFGGIFATAFVISTLTEYLVEGHLGGVLDHRRMMNAIEKLSRHFIVTGYGRVGQEVARALTHEGVPFIIVDVNPDALGAARADGYLCLTGDASQDDVLLAAGSKRAKGLVACADSDVQNVYITLSARTSNPHLFIIARAAFPDAQVKLLNAGADRVVSPYIIAGRHMAQMASDPQLADYLDLLLEGRQLDVRVQEVSVQEKPSLAGRTIQELYQSQLDGMLVVAIDRGQERLSHILPDTVIELEDRLVVVASGEQLKRLATIN